MKHLLMFLGVGLILGWIIPATAEPGNEPEEKVKQTCRLDVMPLELWREYMDKLGIKVTKLEEKEKLNMLDFINNSTPVTDFNPEQVYVVVSSNELYYMIFFQLKGCITRAMTMGIMAYNMAINGLAIPFNRPPTYEILPPTPEREL